MDRRVDLRAALAGRSAGFSMAGDEGVRGRGEGQGSELGRAGVEICMVLECLSWGCQCGAVASTWMFQEADGYVVLGLRREIWTGVRDLEPCTLRWCLKPGEKRTGPSRALATGAKQAQLRSPSFEVEENQGHAAKMSRTVRTGVSIG